MSTEPTPRALRYLQDRGGVFWRWSAAGDAIEWHRGGTIVFAEELRQVVEQLAPDGLPPFDTLVLVLAMCRDDFRERLAAALPERFPLDLTIPRELRVGPTAKATLVEMLLRSRPRESKAIGPEVVAALRSSLLASSVRETRATPGVPLSRCLSILAEGLAGLDPEAARLRQQTGLTELPAAAELDLPPALGARRLVDELRDDQELGGVATLARELMAALHLPRPLADPDDLPLGGISDLANHGSFDRLLLSELAHDPDVLMTRVALGEALYLRREMPPRSQGGCRMVLLDTGVRTWGVPRVFAASVGLALAASAHGDHDVQAFAADGTRLDPVALDRREGLIALLGHQRTLAHPGAALPAFVAACAAQRQRVEAFIVSQRDALLDPAFDRALEVVRASGREVFLVAVDRDGSFEVIAVNARGRRSLESAWLDLAALLPKSKRLHVAADANLPVLLTHRPFPFLLPHASATGYVRFDQTASQTVSVTRDGRLLVGSGTPSDPAREITAELPAGAVLHVSGVVDGEVTVVQRDERGGHHLLRIDVATGSIALFELEIGRAVRHLVQRGAFLFVIWPRSVYAVSLRTGVVDPPLEVHRDVRWQHGPFLASMGEPPWFVLHHDGGGARLERLPLSGPSIVGFFLIDGGTRSCALSADGAVWTPTGECAGVLELPSRIGSVLGASVDGATLLLQSERGAHQYTASVHLASTSPFVATVRVGRPSMIGWRRHKSTGVMFHDSHPHREPICRNQHGILILDGSVAIVGKLTRLITMANRKASGQGQLRLHRLTRGYCYPAGMRPFEDVAPPSAHRCQLRVATWRDGSRVFADGRGLLHFVSADRSLPQFAILPIEDHALVAWASDGRTCGPERLLLEKPNSEAREFLELLRRFAEATA